MDLTHTIDLPVTQEMADKLAASMAVGAETGEHPSYGLGFSVSECTRGRWIPYGLRSMAADGYWVSMRWVQS